MRRLLALVLVVLLGALAAAVPLIAQDQQTMTPEEEKSAFVRFVQDRLSTPERQIRISNIEGVLSTTATINEITIADTEGVWLRVVNAAIDWNQSSLLLGRLDVKSLSAERIDFIRNPEPAAPALPSPEAQPFEVPEFPVAIILQQLSVPSVTFGEDVFGLGSAISVAGSFILDDGNLSADLDIVRLDGPGGTLAARADFRDEDDNLDLAITLTEPPNGIIANLLQLEGRPDVALAVTGAGPVADLRTELTLDAGGTRALGGAATIRQVAEGFAVDADLRGPVGTLVAPQYREFFGAETALTGTALVRSEGGISVSNLSLSGGQLALTGNVEVAEDGFLRAVALEARIADTAGRPVLLPLPGTNTVESAVIDIDYGNTAAEDWSATARVVGVATSDFTAETLAITASGIAANLDDPAARRLTFNGDGMLEGIATEDPAIAAALGDSIGLGFAGLWNAGQPLQLPQLRIAGGALVLDLAGAVDAGTFSGDIAIQTSSLAPFSGLAGRDLAGALDLQASGSISPLSGGFDLTLDGSGEDLHLDEATLDGLIGGTVALSGRVARTEAGIVAQDFRLGNQQVAITADGRFSSQTADFRFALDLADLALLTPEARGAISVAGTAQGQDGRIALNLDLGLNDGRLAGRVVRNAAVTFVGTLAEETLDGNLAGSAFLDGFRVDLSAALLNGPEGRRLSDLRFVAGGTTLTGNVTQDQAGLLTGQLDLSSPDLSTAAALLLVRAEGAVEASVDLSPVQGQQSLAIVGTAQDLRWNDIRVGSADISATIADLFGVPQVDGRLEGTDLAAAGVTLRQVSATASRNGDTTTFAATAALDTGADVALAGDLTPLDDGWRLALDRAELQQGGLSARLLEPASFALAGGSVSLDAVAFDVGGGRITATGSAGEALDITLTVDALPLSIANAVAPDLGLAGTINGTARINGTGTNPEAEFQLTGSGIDAAPLEGLGIAPFTARANGSFASGTVTLASLEAQGNGGLTLAAAGRIPLSGSGLDLRVSGSAPLALGNRFVADRGGQIGGTATLDARITGSLSDPRFAGTVSTAGASYIDPALNLRLENITGSAALEGDRLALSTVTADLATGGSVAVTGSVGLSGNLPVDLAVALRSARYADGNLLVATLSGDLALSGQLLAGPLLSGTVSVETANITVPERIGGGAALVQVEHENLPGDVASTLAKASIDESGDDTGPAASPIRLDIAVNAPNQVFVRGGGLDAEVGGSVRLTGPVNDIQPVGGLELIRGRLSILGQRITFESGTVTLTGDLDPFINLVARAEGDGITVFVTVAGRVSEPEVTFTSNPPLPQDEVLSRLIFNRSMGELSPLQLAKLAGAAASLAGGGSTSLVDSLREASGLADLDIVADDSGNIAVQAGQYIEDNIYLGVQAGAGGQSRVTVNIDLTEDIKAEASLGADGNSEVGVFYENDY